MPAENQPKQSRKGKKETSDNYDVIL